MDYITPASIATRYEEVKRTHWLWCEIGYIMVVNIALNDANTEILEVETNLGKGVNFLHSQENESGIGETEFTLDLTAVKDLFVAINEHFISIESEHSLSPEYFKNIHKSI